MFGNRSMKFTGWDNYLERKQQDEDNHGQHLFLFHHHSNCKPLNHQTVLRSYGSYFNFTSIA
jgi:hypothetical protein